MSLYILLGFMEQAFQCRILFNCSDMAVFQDFLVQEAYQISVVIVAKDVCLVSCSSEKQVGYLVTGNSIITDVSCLDITLRSDSG